MRDAIGVSLALDQAEPQDDAENRDSNPLFRKLFTCVESSDPTLGSVLDILKALVKADWNAVSAALPVAVGSCGMTVTSVLIPPKIA